ncbi:hypothetical protein IT408_04860 [Candidatus Uhrbacteria bacterium]|nr:hypothetical protein [Candidatus Uhrbacteria bacterium]
MKYIFVDVIQIISLLILAKMQFEHWDTAKNDEGIYAIIIFFIGSSIIYFFGKVIRHFFKKNDAIIGEYTNVADDYKTMRDRFRADKRKL